MEIMLAGETDFAGWRLAARNLAMAGIEAADVTWRVSGSDPQDLFGEPASPSALQAVPGMRLDVPRELIARLQTVIHHCDRDRFGFLYRLLLRLTREKNLLKIASDPDIQRFERMEKAIRRDAHKMHAFVRFRQIMVGDQERFVAWFEPDHYIAEREAPFFVQRFTGMHWTILTPWRSIAWNGSQLTVAPGASAADAPKDDAAEELWRTYFASIFNPARLKVKAMQAEMPKKYWRNLPEASLIPALVAGAEKATQEMIARAPTQAPAHHAAVQARYWAKEEPMEQPAEPQTLHQLRNQAEGCTRCPLYRDATQMVFGEGPADADLVFVGEQPGDQEDLAGKPFVGPAGQMFDATLETVGIDRSRVYVTNAVKHFKFTPRGKRRIHAKPNAGEVQACRWWVDKELSMLKPKLVVALGASAASSLLGKTIAVTKIRGQVLRREADGLGVFITVHPSYLLRIPDAEHAARERRLFADDLATVRDLLAV